MDDDYGGVPGSALHFAIRDGRAAVAARLIEKGLNVNTADCNDCTPLHVAESAECATLLLELGADIEALDDNDNTPLIKAASWDMADVMGVLIAGGAELDSKNSHGVTALYEACDCERFSIAMLLLKAGAAADCGAHTTNGRRALHALLQPHFSFDGGVRVQGQTMCNYEEQLKLLDKLLMRGADVDNLCVYGTPIMQTDDRVFIRRLVCAGANPWLGNWQEEMSPAWKAIVGEEFERARSLPVLQGREMGTARWPRAAGSS